MNYFTKLRCLGVACLLSALFSTTAGARDMDATQLAEEVVRGMEMWQVPGMAVAVIDNGEVVMQRGFGRTAADGVAVDEHTLFANASTTKAMVVAGLLMLVDEQKLSLDDPVIKHLPEAHFPAAAGTQQVTVRDLLAHRTGLPSTDYWSFLQLTPLEVQMERLRMVPLEAAPRTRLIYQNTMYELAGLIIERVSGQRWDEFLRERLWQPIGMLETYGTRAGIPADKQHVMPHDLVAGRLTVVQWDLPAEMADAAGSAWSSIHDMSKWARFLLNDGVTEDGIRLISEKGMHAMFEPQQLAVPDDFYPTVELTKPHWRSYGLGWFQQDFQGRKIDFHTGSLDGLTAIIGLDAHNDRAVIVMANRDHAEMRHALLWEVMDDTAGSQRRDWNRDIFDLYAAKAEKEQREWAQIETQRLEGTRPSLELDAYLGTWRNELFGDIELERSGDKFVLRTAVYEYAVTHWHLDTFLVTYPTWSSGVFASFTVGPAGNAIALDFFGQEFHREQQRP